jgi:hypothetical protein
METWEAQARRKWGKGKREAREQEVKREKGVDVEQRESARQRRDEKRKKREAKGEEQRRRKESGRAWRWAAAAAWGRR